MLSAKRPVKFLITIIWYLFASITVLAAAGFGAARLLLPTANQYTHDIEQQVYEIIGQPLTIQSLDADWNGFTPMLVLKNVEIYRKDKSSVVMRFPKIRVGLDIFTSLVNQTITVSRFDLVGANLFLTRSETGKVKITGLDLDGASNAKMDLGFDSSRLTQWMFNQDSLSLELHNLIFTDKFEKQKVYHLSNITLLLRNKNDRHIIDATLNFAGQRNKELIVSIDSYGDMLDFKSWSGEVYSSGSALDLSDIPGLESVLQPRVTLGELNHEIWIEIKDSKITRIQANLKASNLLYSSISVSDNKQQLRYEKLAGNFLWQKSDTGWVVNAREFKVKTASGYWPRTSFAIEYHQGEQDSIKINVDYLQLQDLVEVATVFSNLEDTILPKFVAAQPSGIVKSLYFSTTLGDKMVYQGFANLENVSAVLDNESIIFSGLNGKINLNNASGTFALESEDLIVDVPSVFNYPLNIKEVGADVEWKVTDSGISLNIENYNIDNADISLSGRLALQLPNNDEPASIDMAADIQRAAGNRIYYYLPHKILSSDTNSWLKGAFKAAEISNGRAVVKGLLRDFPYKKKKGQFKIDFQVENVVLEYAEKWPLIHKMNANVLFESTKILVKAKKAAVLSSSLKKVVVEIPDISASTVKVLISGQVIGQTQDKLNYLMASPPLKEKYGAVLDEVRARGLSKLGLDIKLDLDDEIQSNVSGFIEFKDNQMSLLSLGKVLTHATGRVEFSEQKVSAKNITAKLIGEDAVINIMTKSMLEKGQRDDFILVQAKSSILASEYSKRYLPVMQDLWSGKSPLELSINIPLNKHDRNKRSDKGVEIIFDSFLKGIEIRLPKPYNKNSDETLHLNGVITLAENNRIRYRTRYGGNLDSLIEYNSSPSGEGSNNHLRGEIRFGTGVAVLPTRPGLRLVGELDELKIDIWKSLFDQFEVKTSAASSKLSSAQRSGKATVRQNSMTLVHSADVTVKKFSAWGQRAENLHLIVKNSEKGLSATLDSKAIKGQVEIPVDLDSKPIIMDFDYINLDSDEEDVGGGAVDPRDFPSFLARSNSVTYKDKNFGKVDLSITKLTEGIRIEKLSMQSNSTVITANGSWLWVNGKSKSNFNFRLESSNLGASMVGLGYKDSIEGGFGTVDVKLNWPGGLTEFEVDQLSGEVHFSLADGRLLEYDPLGKASILGLFSIQTLPRRLFLDFSDLVDKGLSFDSITGDVNIEEGDAYTNNFKMQGPVIGAALAGRVGLATQDYDQIVKVELRVSDILSFVGLLIASPWAIIIPQLLKEEFNSASVLEYSLTGSWSDPILEPIVEVEEPDDDEGQE